MGGSLRAGALLRSLRAQADARPRGRDAAMRRRATRRPSKNGLAVIGPMARTAADLALTLDVIAGPTKPVQVDLPPARQKRLADFRVLVVDAHPLGPTAVVIRESIATLVDKLSRAGVKISQDTSRLRICAIRPAFRRF